MERSIKEIGSLSLYVISGSDLLGKFNAAPITLSDIILGYTNFFNFLDKFISYDIVNQTKCKLDSINFLSMPIAQNDRKNIIVV